ncbi:(2Fe-2S)-binding protein [Enemella evansiae]|uniref:QcrA and Rieske domain-containing protein n=1 Tax=Enemella evansiae TaxID=2016499 RepID=UPI000B9774BB|nr:Rieske (2Fe-2S) protein [Enemella evansiae]OYO07011.1 (2Fe-2S)-binding protein [Enemella evansiae]
MTSRRALLGAAGGLSALAVGALTGCSSGAGSRDSRSSAPPAGDASAPAAPAGAVASTAEIPVGSGKILPAAQLVVTQPTAGEFVGLSAFCTHQGCIVSQLRGNTIVCGCHGSQFGLDGAVQKGPADKPLEKIPVRVEGDGIVKG